MISKSKSFKSLGVKGSKAFKRQFSNISHRTSSSKILQSSVDGDTEIGTKPDASDRLGDLVQRQTHSSGRRDNSSDSRCSNRNVGMVRGGAGQGFEKAIPNYSNKHQRGRPSNGSSNMGSNSQLVVEIPHGHSSGVLGECRNVEQATKAIRNTTL